MFYVIITMYMFVYQFMLEDIMRCERARRALYSGADCVIVGDCLSARMLSLKIILLDGRSCVICDTQKSIFGYIFSWVPFWRLVEGENERLVCEQLCDLADMCEDSTHFLFVNKPCYKKTLDSYRPALECKYILG